MFKEFGGQSTAVSSVDDTHITLDGAALGMVTLGFFRY